MKLSTLLKFAAIMLIIIVSVGSLIYWLWQRQPKPQDNQLTTFESTQEAEINNEIEKNNLTVNPKNGSVLSENGIKLQVETNPGEFVIVYSNLTQSVGKTDENGKLLLDFELEGGLNLINIATLNENLQQTQSQPLSLYVQQSDDATSVFAGPVKSIFGEVITITTTEQEQTIRQKTSTELILPSGETDAEDNGVRVGDYLIALGTVENEKDFNTTSIEVIRDNKPQNIEEFVAGITLSEVNNNLFSIRNQKDSKISEFTIDRNTTISLNGQESKTDKITKDKKTIIIYHPDHNDNIANLIYLLP